MKTTEEIAKCVGELREIKPRVRKQSAFGDNHHDAIEAQIEALMELMDVDDAYSKYEPTGDDDIDSDEGRAENVLNAALDAIRWRDETEDYPVDGWQSLVR